MHTEVQKFVYKLKISNYIYDYVSKLLFTSLGNYHSSLSSNNLLLLDPKYPLLENTLLESRPRGTNSHLERYCYSPSA